MLAELAQKHLQLLTDNIAKGDYSVCNQPVFPGHGVEGVGTHEAPRGTLSHWIVIKDEKIKNYQAVVPSTWNASPRDASGAHGPYEASLLHTPLARPEEPLRSFAHGALLRSLHGMRLPRVRSVGPADRQSKGVMKNMLIGGIGNVLLGDDGVGPYVAQLLASRYEFEDGVEVLDLGTPALDLIDQISGRDVVILIDSVDTDAAPGTVLLYRKDEIMRHRPALRMDPHSHALVDTLHQCRTFGVAPASLLLVGIAAESCEPGCSLSKHVKAVLDQAITAILSELDRSAVGYRLRESATEARRLLDSRRED